MTNESGPSGNLQRHRVADRRRHVQRSILRSALATILAAAFLTLAPLSADPATGVNAWLGVDTARADCPAEFRSCGGHGGGCGGHGGGGGGGGGQATGCYSMASAVCVVCFDSEPRCRLYNMCDSSDDDCHP